MKNEHIISLHDVTHDESKGMLVFEFMHMADLSGNMKTQDCRGLSVLLGLSYIYSTLVAARH